MPKHTKQSSNPIYNYPDIQSALDRAIQQKSYYEKSLCGRNILYLFVDPATQDISAKKTYFSKENYLHLTGLDYQSVQYNKRVLGLNVPTNATHFYERLGKDTSLVSDVSFIVWVLKHLWITELKKAKK